MTKPKSKKLKLGLTIAVVSILVVGGGYFAYDQFAKPKDSGKRNAIAVKRADVDLAVLATGTIRPEQDVKISPKQTGLLKSLLVKQGDRVKKGEIIATMDDSNLVGQVEAARGAYNSAHENYLKMKNGNRPQEVAASHFQQQRASKVVQGGHQNVRRLEAQISAMESQLKRDEMFAQRQAALAKEGAVADQARMDAFTAAEVTRSNLNAARREIQQAKSTAAQNESEFNASKEQFQMMKSGFRKEEIAGARYAADQARGNLIYQESLLADTKIRAPFDGVITQKYADAGSIVTPTTSAATTSATSSSIVSLAGRLEMVAQVSESNIPKIKIGQEVDIMATAHPGKVFHGKVTQIAPAAIVTQNVTTFEVHASLDKESEGHLLAGMNISSRFSMGKLHDVLTVPTAAIVSKEGKMGVYVPSEDGESKFKELKLGPSVDEITVVENGLSDGDKILLGLSKAQLAKEGYATQSPMKRGGAGLSGGAGMMGGGRGMRGLGR